ncbi:MAG: stage II sporulation protein M [Crocinitomicaceae bacterium]|nr:stage II sporulation protein M [Crocinitomicaceae bacterium]
MRVILGDDYVESTERRIAAGNPMGVYGTMDEGSMFWQITVNNIRVAFMVFAAGVTFTILSYFCSLQRRYAWIISMVV